MRRVLIAVGVVLLIAARAPQAFGQCSISVLDVNGTPMLCADAGDGWQWTGPGGFSSTDMCITASTPGTYTLRVYDASTGQWSDPCSQAVGKPPGPSCSITGVDSVCAGSSVQWCGPTGDYDYAWSGPAGFAANTACVDVSAAGTYSLTLTDRASGAAGDPCALTLRTLQCPAPHLSSVCPRPASWWASGCASGTSPLDAEAFARVAAGVDQRSAVWSYGGTPQGLCALVGHPRHANSMTSTKRQYAAVLANITAAALGIVDYEGHAVGLDESRTLDDVRGVPAGTTLAQWVASTEHAMLSLVSDAGHGRSAREALRRIRHQAKDINRGPESGDCPGQFSAAMESDDDDDLGDALGGSASALALGGGDGGDPLTGGSRMRWTLERAGQVEVSIVDVTGRHVRLVASGMYAAGTHEFSWDGRDDDGRTMRAGAYFVAGSIGGERTSLRLFLLR